MEFSSLGGWVATRASGMKKNIYGNIEDLVSSGVVMMQFTEYCAMHFLSYNNMALITLTSKVLCYPMLVSSPNYFNLCSFSWSSCETYLQKFQTFRHDRITYVGSLVLR
jgi:FAD/FMN-containing dehydrogenase